MPMLYSGTPNPKLCLELIQSAYKASNDIFYRKQDRHLAFRGSETRLDWIRNALALQTPLFDSKKPEWGDPQVHLGFMTVWREVRSQVLADLADMEPGTIIITGHSQGGAVAAIAAADLIQKNAMWNPILLTFGAPRVGDHAFAFYLNAHIGEYIRVENWGDPVPKVPRFQNWMHAGRQHRVGSMLNVMKFPHQQHHALAAYAASEY